MKELNNRPNIKLYIAIAAIVICSMGLGVFIAPSVTSVTEKIIHLFFVILVSIMLVIYPFRETNFVKGILIFSIAGYFYMLFLLYPETTFSITLISLLPSIAIAFFHQRLYFTIAIFNLCITNGLFAYVYLFDKGTRFDFMLHDFFGNVLDFFIGQVILFFVFFITCRRMEKLKVYYEQLQKTERLKTTGQMAAAVAHEIRNPLTVVKGFLQFYNNDNRFPKETKNHFHIMLEELGTAEGVINDFLSIAKPNQENTATSNAHEVVSGVVDLLSSYAFMNNITFSIAIQEDITVYCSKVEFKQVLINLIKNAVESIDHGGHVTITSEQKASNLYIYIEDNGVGMNEDELKKLGTAFYSLKTKGTGLGLMICYNIMEKYGGKIKFTSVKGKGTVVSLCFQIANN